MLAFFNSCAPKYGSPEAVNKQLKIERKSTNNTIDKTLESMPDWMSKLPQDVNFIYTNGTYVSKDMQKSIDGASRSALNQLAITISGNVNSLIKEYALENGYANDAEITNELSRATSIEAINTEVVGHQRIDTVIIREEQSYRAFVLFRYPIGEFNKLALQIIKNNQLLDSKLNSTDAFKELENRVNR